MVVVLLASAYVIHCVYLVACMNNTWLLSCQLMQQVAWQVQIWSLVPEQFFYKFIRLVCTSWSMLRRSEHFIACSWNRLGFYVLIIGLNFIDLVPVIRLNYVHGDQCGSLPSWSEQFIRGAVHHFCCHNQRLDDSIVAHVFTSWSLPSRYAFHDQNFNHLHDDFNHHHIRDSMPPWSSLLDYSCCLPQLRREDHELCNA